MGRLRAGMEHGPPVTLSVDLRPKPWDWIPAPYRRTGQAFAGMTAWRVGSAGIVKQLFRVGENTGLTLAVVLRSETTKNLKSLYA